MWQAGVLDVLTYLIFIATQLSDAIVIPIFRMKKLRDREAKDLPKMAQQMRLRAGI